MSGQTEIEVGGVKFKGGKIFLVLTVLSSIGGAMWAGFEFYKDYMDMREKIETYVAPDLSGFDKNIAVLQEEVTATVKVVETEMNALKEEVQLMDENMQATGERVSDIKNDLRDDLVRMEKIIDQVEDNVKETEDDVRNMINNAEERFENKRDSLQNDYDQAKDRLQTQTAQELKDLENRLNKKLQRALDNPLAN